MDAFDINAKLLSLHGHDTVYEQPIWRLMWSGTLMVKRQATYEDYTPAGIYLGKKTGIREHKKYWHLPDCWVLEHLEHVQTKGVHDEMNMPYSYELVYAFLDRQNQLLPLAWLPIEFILHHWLIAERTHLARYDETVAKKEKEDVAKCRDILEEEDPKWQPTFEASVSVKEESKVEEVTKNE